MILAILLAATLAEARQIKIGIIDTGADLQAVKPYLCNDKSFYDMSESLTENDLDNTGHGTVITNIIVDGLKGKVDFCIRIIKWCDSNCEDHALTMSEIYAFEFMDSDVVNASAGGTSNNGEMIEVRTIRRFLNSGGIYVVAAGNNAELMTKKICMYYPACADGRIIVSGAGTSEAGKTDYSNYGKQIVDQWRDGSMMVDGELKEGTSMSSPRVTVDVVLDLGKIFVDFDKKMSYYMEHRESNNVRRKSKENSCRGKGGTCANRKSKRRKSGSSGN